MRTDGKVGGMIAKLKEDVPTLLTIGDKVIKIFAFKNGSGQKIRIVADRDVVVTCTHIVKANEVAKPSSYAEAH
jgi:hypothetical protein